MGMGQQLWSTNLMAESLESKIVKEVAEKVDAFESRTSTFMANVGEWADFYKIKPGERKEGSYSNPRSTEFFRSCNALAGLMFRMITANDPFFKTKAMHPNVSYEDLHNLESVISTQLRVSEYKKYLLKACQFVLPFGTVIAEESWKTIGVNQFRNIPTTTFRPRVLDQVAFDQSAIEIDDADWIGTMDLVSKAQLQSLLRDDKEGVNRAWNAKALQKAIDLEETGNTINRFVQNRIRRAQPNGGNDETVFGSRKELVMYYGQLDTLNDGMEYVVGLINRKILVRFHANNFQHGRRQFRVGKWKDFDGPYGLGIGSLLGHESRSLDSAEQLARDAQAFSSYNQFTVKDGVNLDDLKVRPNNLIPVEDHNDIKALPGNPAAVQSGQMLLDFLQQNFRNAAGAPDELQAMVSEATTATQSSLAQNSAMRNVAIVAEQFADKMVKEHLEVMHANNVMNLKKPIDIERAGLVKRVYPRDIKFDADFIAKTVTDKDYTPKRLTELQNLLTTLISTKSQHPDQMNISILPIVKEIAHQLNVNPEDVLQSPTAPAGFPQDDLGDLGAGTVPPLGGEPTNEAVVDTPVGPTIVGP
jgi:hypothetical protein